MYLVLRFLAASKRKALKRDGSLLVQVTAVHIILRLKINQSPTFKKGKKGASLSLLGKCSPEQNLDRISVNVTICIRFRFFTRMPTISTSFLRIFLLDYDVKKGDNSVGTMIKEPVDNKYLSDVVTSAQIPVLPKRHHTDKKAGSEENQWILN